MVMVMTVTCSGGRGLWGSCFGLVVMVMIDGDL